MVLYQQLRDKHIWLEDFKKRLWAANYESVDVEQESLGDQSSAGPLGANLTALYSFVTRRLSEANIANDESGLDESANVLRELQAGWNEIRAEVLAQSASESVPV